MSDKKLIKKTVKTTSITLAVTAGTTIGVIGYNVSKDFVPAVSDREFNSNHVRFSDADDVVGNNSSVSGDNSAIIDTNNENDTTYSNASGYLFDEQMVDQVQSDSSSKVINTNSIDNNAANTNETLVNNTSDVFNFTNDGRKGDVVIANTNRNDYLNRKDEPIGETADNIFAGERVDISSGTGESGKSNPISKPDGESSSDRADGSGDTTENPKYDASDKTGTEKPEESDKDKSDKDKSDKDKSDKDKPAGDKPVISDKPGEHPKPDKPEDEDSKKDWSDSAKDPVADKPIYRPGVGVDVTKPYEEKKDPPGTDTTLSLDLHMPIGSDAPALYKGQTVDERNVFYAFDAVVIKKTSIGTNSYIMGNDAYDKYIRVTGISFNDGKTWNKSFPIKIPVNEGINDIQVQIEYRFFVKDEWEKKTVSYNLIDSRVMVLSDTLKYENETIKAENILNYDQYLNNGDLVNLYGIQSRYLKADADGLLENVFPGWAENGNVVPWFYKVTEGRHILQPADTIPLDKKYKVKLVNKWFNNKGEIDPSGNTYGAVQTLVGVDTGEGILLKSVSKETELKVPKYIQAIEPEENIETDYINIPDTVMYINTGGDDDNTNELIVKKSYKVADGNPYFSVADGILMDKKQTQMLAIPNEKQNLVIKDTIEKVSIDKNNNIKNITFKAGNIGALPEINYDYLNECTITVDDNILDEFMLSNNKQLSHDTITIRSDNQPDNSYKIDNGFIIKNDSELYKVAGDKSESVTLPDNIKIIDSNAFEDAKNINKLILMGNDAITLKDDCLKDSLIDTIVCSSEKQKSGIIDQLAAAGKSDIEVVLFGKTSDGFSYYSSVKDGIIQNVLIEAPKDIIEFNGIIEGNIHITSIEPNCFEDCQSLKWVTLPEDVSGIGREAFLNCASLEGVLIQTTESIYIGDDAFSGCESLRFVASNAVEAVMENGYNPQITYDDSGYYTYYNFYILDGAQGYCENTTVINDIDYIEQFKVVESNGYKYLYASDYEGKNISLLRAENDIEGEVSVDTDTMFIHEYAFAGSGGDGGFTINWNELSNLYIIYDSAFAYSGLSGQIEISGAYGIQLYKEAFYQCSKITSVTISTTIYGIDEFVFNNCTNLRTVKLGNISYADYACLYPGVFTGCESLESIEFADSTPPQLMLYGMMTYQFNYDWTSEEEAQKLKLIVPEGSKDAYVLGWRYTMCGYTGAYSGMAYLDMWDEVQMDLIDWDTFEFPEDEVVDQEVKRRLLERENQLRDMLDMEIVDELEDFYPIRNVDGYLTLIGCPSYTTELDFTIADLGMPDGWFIDYIGRNAFNGVNNLSRVVIADNISGIYSGAFNDCAANTDKLTIEFTGEEPLALFAEENDEGILGFDFGVELSKLNIIVPAGCKDAYIEAWSEVYDVEQLNEMIQEKENM